MVAVLSVSKGSVARSGLMTPMSSPFRPNAPFSQSGDCALSSRGFIDHEMMDDLGLAHLQVEQRGLKPQEFK